MKKGVADGAKSSGIVVFLGDATVVDPMVHALVDERMGASSQDLDFEVFRHGERSLSELEASMRQVGMFAPRRAAWLRGFVEPRKRGAGSAAADDEGDDDAGAAEGEGGDELLAMLERGVPEGNLLVISAAALDARSRLFKWMARQADVRDHRVATETSGKRRGKLGEAGLADAVSARLAELGVERVDSGVLDEIVRRSGNLVGEALQEVERVVLAARDPARLTVADVRQNMRDLALGWVFDFTEAIEARDLGRAEALVARLLGDGEAPLRLAALLASQVGRLLAARPIVDSLPPGALRMRGPEFLKGPGASLPQAWQGWGGYFRLKAAANFSREELVSLHHELRRLDSALKGSPVAPLLLFSRFLQAACLPAPGTGSQGFARAR